MSRGSAGLRRSYTRAWEGLRTLSLPGPGGCIPSVVAAPWRQLSLGGSGLPRMHLASLRALNRQPFRAGLDKSQVTRDGSPGRLGGRRSLRGRPVGQAARLGGPLAHQGGGGTGRKTELVFEAQGLKGDCVCPGQRLEGGDVSHWWPGRGAAQLSGTTGTRPTLL